jgi:hypothetical protein
MNGATAIEGRARETRKTRPYSPTNFEYTRMNGMDLATL